MTNIFQVDSIRTSFQESESSSSSFFENKSNNSMLPPQQQHLTSSENIFSHNNQKSSDVNGKIVEEDEYREEKEETHLVKLAFNIVASFPVGLENDSTLIEASKSRLPEGPKPINFYKFEYQLIPDDNETLFITDVVTYKTSVKLYPEKSEARVIKAWEHENRLWVTWSQSHEIMLTKAKLLKLFDYELVFKIWDMKDYCSAKTRFDKPKPFKFSKTGENSEETIRSLVIEQCENYLKQIPPELHDKLQRRLPNQTKSQTPDSVQELTENMTNTLIAMPARSVLANSVVNRLNELALDSELNKNVKSRRSTNKENRLTVLSKMSKISTSEMSELTSKTPRQRKPKEKTRKEILAEQENIKKNGINRIKLRWKILFSGCRYVMARLDEPMTTLDDCFISINLENSLMSERQLYELNPITIRVEKLCDMPNTPVGYETLRDECEKTYCSYTFFGQPIYRTCSKVQESDIYFDDINVYLAGLLSKPELHEFIHASLFHIEVHDRDRKSAAERATLHPQATIKPCLFGNDADDEQISNANSIASKHTLHNPFESKAKRWDNYGVAKLDLHELTLGKKMLEYFVNVLPCSAPDVLGKNTPPNSKNSNAKLLSTSEDDKPIASGAYLDSNTNLCVRISVAKPLFQDDVINAFDSKPIDKQACPYGRIIIRTESSDIESIRSIIELVRLINSSTLQLSHLPITVQEDALSTYKLTEEERQNKYLNIISGFHLIDSKNNLFVLEGLRNVGVKQIYERLESGKEKSAIELLYNSSLSFSRRLYIDLEVELVKIKLFEPLEDLVKKPLLYIRDMTPKSSFEALIKLNQLLKEYRLRDVIRCDLLPSSQMILSMSKEYGVPLTDIELNNLKDAQCQKDNVNETGAVSNDLFEDATTYSKIPHTSRIWTPLDNLNINFITLKKEKETANKDFILENVKLIPKISQENKHKRPIKRYLTVHSPYHYSSQALNSTELGLKEFREYINQNEPKRLYSYNPEFHHSATFVPVNVNELDKWYRPENKSQWKTQEGWIYPGVKSTLQSNEHPKKLDPASLDKINEPWEENNLHAYKMKSPLERRFLPHTIRDKDFNVWSTKVEDEKIFPITIFESGDSKERLEKEIQKMEKDIWKSRLVVENPQVKVHRLSASTEQKSFGFDSSNQLDRMKDLLKSEPKKKGLLTGGVTFNNIPPLSAVKTEYSDQEKLYNDRKGYTAGETMNMRITDFGNVVPVHNYERKKYNALKGKDFDIVSMPSRSAVYKRLAKHEDRQLESHMYIIPNQGDMDEISARAGATSDEEESSYREVIRKNKISI